MKLKKGNRKRWKMRKQIQLDQIRQFQEYTRKNRNSRMKYKRITCL